MEKPPKGLLFFIGWILSPFTWWNDAFVNIPISYLIANLLFFMTRLPFARLVVAIYWLTNILGIFFMFVGGKDLLSSQKNRAKNIIFTSIFIIVYTIIILFLSRQGKLLPLSALRK